MFIMTWFNVGCQRREVLGNSKSVTRSKASWFPTHQEIEIVENATSQDVFLQAHRRHHQLHRQFDFELKLLLFMCAFEYLCVYVVTWDKDACVAVHDYMITCVCVCVDACVRVCVYPVVSCLCSSVVCHTSVAAVCSNLRSQLGALVIIKTLPLLQH